MALIAPFSGPWARQGDLMLKGAEMAIDDINAQGGIKALGGAKLKLVVIDAGDNIEKAKNAAQRMVAQEADLVGCTGAWLSSFTLAVTEVTERAGLPCLTLSYSDQITARGFQYIFQTSPTGAEQALQALPTIVNLAETATGRVPKNVAIVMDNTAASVSFAKPMRESGLAKFGMTLVVDETFTPPLADATALVQKVRSARPDLLFLLPTALPDDKLLVEKLNEFGLGRGRVPVVSNGAHIAAPEMLSALGKEMVEGIMTVVGNWRVKGQEALLAEYQKRTGEPWMTQETVSTYGDMWIFKAALESARAADRKKVAAALRTHGSDRRSRALLSRRTGEVRRQGAASRCAAADRPVAERPAAHRVSGGPRGRDAGLAEALDYVGLSSPHAGLYADVRPIPGRLL